MLSAKILPQFGGFATFAVCAELVPQLSKFIQRSHYFVNHFIVNAIGFHRFLQPSNGPPFRITLYSTFFRLTLEETLFQAFDHNLREQAKYVTPCFI